MKVKKEDGFFGEKKNVKKKPGDMQINNLVEEIQSTLNPCIKCGMCKSLCPLFKSILKEEVSPRGHCILLNENKLNELVFKCTMCKACEEKCPLNLKICDAMKKAREVLVLREKGLKTNKKMVEQIRKTGNPFDSNAQKDPDKLYCC